MPLPRVLTVSLVLGCSAALLASCSSSSSSSSPTPATNQNVTNTACSPTALSRVTAPVQINFWESAVRANATTLEALTTKFNTSQNKVHVNLVAQTSYDDTWQKYQAGLTNGQLPDVVQLQDTDTQGAIDTQSFQPAQSCINGFKYSTGDLLPRALAYWKVSGVQWAMPFAVSGPVLYYNKLAFQKAGLNPNDPPTDLADLVTAAQTLKKAGQGGMGLVIDPWHFETWLATENQLLVNNDNGRTARATKVAFDTPDGVAIFKELDEMVSSGAATTNSANGSAEYDNLLGTGSGKYAMTIDTSAALGTIQSLLSSGQYPNVELGVAAFPKATATSDGGVQPGGSALWISKRSSPVKQAAAWEFVSFLDSTQSQATWSAGTGYIPLRTSSANTALIQSLWRTNPAFKVAYSQLVGGPTNAATAGAVLGPYDEMRIAVASAESSMYVNGVSPEAAIKAAASASNALISNYNQRLG